MHVGTVRLLHLNTNCTIDPGELIEYTCFPGFNMFGIEKMNSSTEFHIKPLHLMRVIHVLMHIQPKFVMRALHSGTPEHNIIIESDVEIITSC